MILSFIDYVIIIYLVMYVIFAIAIFRHLCRPNVYRLIISCIMAIVWPLILGLLVVIWVETLLCAIKELIVKE